MKRITKSVMIFLICILIFSVISGCGREDKETVTSDSEKMINIKLYYLNNERTDFIYDEMDIDQLSSTENIIDSVMSRLITEQENSELKSPVVDGMVYQRYNYDGEGNITIVFNVDYEKADTYEMLVSKAAFTNTLCQIDSITSVTFDMLDLLNEREEMLETYRMDSFAYLDDYGIAYSYEESIYYPAADNKSLIKVTVELDSTSNVSLEEQIINLLCESDDNGYQQAIADPSFVNMVTVNNNICYVDFTEDFLKYETGIDNSLVIYSIVNSLCSINNVESVSISVNGDRQKFYGDIDLNVNLLPDYTYVQ